MRLARVERKSEGSFGGVEQISLDVIPSSSTPISVHRHLLPLPHSGIAVKVFRLHRVEPVSVCNLGLGRRRDP